MSFSRATYYNYIMITLDLCIQQFSICKQEYKTPRHMKLTRHFSIVFFLIKADFKGFFALVSVHTNTPTIAQSNYYSFKIMFLLDTLYETIYQKTCSRYYKVCLYSSSQGNAFVVDKQTTPYLIISRTYLLIYSHILIVLH